LRQESGADGRLLKFVKCILHKSFHGGGLANSSFACSMVTKDELAAIRIKTEGRREKATCARQAYQEAQA
jgi:hypothetical protein